MPERDHTGTTVVVLGGAALVAWLLFRGKGTGLRAPGDGHGTGELSSPATRCVLWIRSSGITLDGAVADLDTVIARCRLAGTVEVHVTGGASQRVFEHVQKALREAGVVFTVHDHSGDGPPRESQVASAPAGRNGSAR